MRLMTYPSTCIYNILKNYGYNFILHEFKLYICYINACGYNVFKSIKIHFQVMKYGPITTKYE